MKTLALEFSSSLRSVALFQDRTRVAEAQGGKAHFGLIDQCLTDAGWNREMVEHIVVGVGPGSHAGIRSAISMAQGWRLGAGITLSQQSSMNAIAGAVHASGIRGRGLCLVDAQRGEWYAAECLLDAESGVVQGSIRLVSSLELQPVAAHLDFVAGPEVPREIHRAIQIFPLARYLAPDGSVADFLEPIYLRQTTFVKQQPRNP